MFSVMNLAEAGKRRKERLPFFRTSKTKHEKTVGQDVEFKCDVANQGKSILPSVRVARSKLQKYATLPQFSEKNTKR